MKLFVFIFFALSFFTTKSQTNSIINTNWLLVSIQDKTENKTISVVNEQSSLKIADSMIYIGACNAINFPCKIIEESKKIICTGGSIETTINCPTRYNLIESYYHKHTCKLNYSFTNDSLSLYDEKVTFKYVIKK